MTEVLDIARPRVDVVVPFRGDRESLAELRRALAMLRRSPGDTITIVDNTPGHEGETRSREGIRIILANQQATPGFARNAGVALGGGEWIVFIDADARPDPELLDRYFDPPPGPRTGLLAGGVRDEPVASSAKAPARYAYLKDSMSQRQTFRLGHWAFAQLANAACRRKALEDVGGIRDDVRAGEDADLCYRLRRCGWEIERREGASVIHRNRQTTREFVVQKALHGAGAAWLERTYPGSFPPRRRAGLILWAARHAANGLAGAIRRRSRDEAVLAVFDPLEQLAYEFGRALPNERPLRRGRAAPRG